MRVVYTEEALENLDGILIRYPYKVFYRNTGRMIEILYIHHAAREE